MILLAVGDVVGEPGLATCERHLRSLRKLYAVDLCVVNGENAALLGITPPQAVRLYEAGADVITMGNHTWKKQQIVNFMEGNAYLIRPLNYAPQTPGQGYTIVTLPSGNRCAVVNVQGRCLMDYFSLDSPFVAMDKLLKAQKEKAELFVVDFHAEATSEKLAMAYHLDKRVSVLYGTHTHVPTADAKVFPGGLGYITDVGMTGASQSVLGVDPAQSLSNYLGNMPRRMEAAGGPCVLQGALFEVDEGTGRCVKAERVEIE